jgi:uncharacterized protein (DUF697 family)
MIVNKRNKKLIATQSDLLQKLTLERKKNRVELQKKEKKIQQQKVQRIVKNHVLSGSTIGLIPIPFIDTFALSANQLNMLLRLSEHYQLDFDKKRAKIILIALISGSLPTFTVLGLSSVLKLIPGIGTLGGNASLSILGGAITYATGQSFIKHFEAGGTLHDFHARNYVDFFKQKLKEGRQYSTKMFQS